MMTDKGSRLWPRLLVASRVLPRLLLVGQRSKPERPSSILVAHHLLLGDTIMLAPLLKKLRRDHPHARIVMLCPKPWLPLFGGRPYGVEALPYDVRSVPLVRRLLDEGPFDWALVPGDNRWSWIARAMGAQWITAFAGDSPRYKNWPVDEFVDWPEQPSAWGDIAATLAPGSEPELFVAGEWPAPERPSGFPVLPAPYALLHLGASSPHKLWEPEKWRVVIDWTKNQGITPVISVGPGERELAMTVDPAGKYPVIAGNLDLAGLWRLISGARFLLCPDTGIAHLGRLTGTPTIALFGPGSPVISGAGRFWQDSPFHPLTVADIPCRDQNLLFERTLPWVRHCWRSPKECGNPICMQKIMPPMVIDKIAKALH